MRQLVIALGLAVAGCHAIAGYDDLELVDVAPAVAGSGGGALQWVRSIGGTGDDHATDIALRTGGPLVTGRVREAALARFDPAGVLQWVRTFPGAEDSEAINVAAVSNVDDYVVVGGWFSGEMTPDGGDSLVSAGSYDGFVTLFDATGEHVWSRAFGGPEYDSVHGLVLRAGVFAVGAFRGTVAPGGVAPIESAGEEDVFVAHYLGDGTLDWVRSSGGTELDSAGGLRFTGTGELRVAGEFNSPTITFDSSRGPAPVLDSSGGSDLFLARYDDDGAIDWVRSSGGPGNEFGYAVTPLDATIDGEAVCGGRFSDAAVFGDGDSAETTLVSAGLGDAVVSRYAPDGSLAWVRAAGGAGDDITEGVAIASDGTVYAVGSYGSNPCRFCAGEQGQLALPSAGGTDAFLMRLAP